MKIKTYAPEQFHIAKHLLFWTVIIIPVAVITGSLVALFLWMLDLATLTRNTNRWLLFLLPLAGIFIAFIYKKYGKNSIAGNNLILEEIHKPGGGIPFRMAPLVLLSTIITHLFGGSAGREGTAVQMGGSIAALFSKWYKISPEQVTTLLMCGTAAGFGAVFGTPVAGCIFALEVVAVGRIRYNALIPCLIAALLADITCSSYGIRHTHYSIAFYKNAHQLVSFIAFDVIMLAKVIMAGVAFGLVGFLFGKSIHLVKDTCSRFVKNIYFIPVIGGITVIIITHTLGTFDYNGLGVVSSENGVSIVSAFKAGGATPFSWLWKLILTAITLGTGFKGGEVTPLFFVGATLGNVLAVVSGAPVDLFAGLGFIAVFAAATNTPIACTIMGIELFGSENMIYYAIACFTAYYFSGHTGIYSSQRLAVNKFHKVFDEEQKLAEVKKITLGKPGRKA